MCFESPSTYEITVAGKKLIGSAQARRMGGILQHGSLPLHGDLARITQVLAYKNEADRSQAASRLLERAVTAEAVLGAAPSWEQAVDAFTQAFQECLNLELTLSSLTSAEEQRARQLAIEKYGSDTWTEHR